MSFMDQLPILIIAVPLLGAFLTPILGMMSKKLPRYTSTLFLAVSALLVALMAFEVYGGDGTPIIYTLGSSDPTPFRIVLEIDAFSVFMAIIMAGVSLAVSIYSWSFTDKYTGQDKFYTLILLVVVGSYGMTLTGDLFNLFVFFEISSIALSGLVAFRMNRGESFEAAFKYMMYSTLSGLFLLFAIALLYSQYGVLNIALLAQGITADGFTPLNKVVLALLIGDFAMKAGAVPLHMPSPYAYSESPGGISTLFMAASQAGLYGLFRASFTLFGGAISSMGYAAVGWIVIILGVLSMFIGVTMALVQKDVKRLMAYHCISQTGYILLGVGVGIAVLGDATAMDRYGKAAIEGGLFHTINNALYKGLLFLTAGAMFYATGTRNLNEMRGLGHNMKITTMFFLIGAIAISGIPPSNGFSSKLLIYESVFQFNPALSAIAMFVSVLTLASFVKVFYSAFLGPKMKDKEIKEVPSSMIFGMAILVAAILAFSLFPGLVLDTLIKPAVEALLRAWPIPGGV